MLKKRDGTTDWSANIQWIILIGLVILGIYNMGKNSNKQMTQQEIRENKAYCYQWHGKSCDDPNFNPE